LLRRCENPVDNNLKRVLHNFLISTSPPLLFFGGFLSECNFYMLILYSFLAGVEKY
jgi:hypothetical protein